MKRVAIIGGGIAGLSAAYYLEMAKRESGTIEWTLFEKSDRLGGVTQTERRDGYLLEAGPDSFLTTKPDGAKLCHDLGIGDHLIASNDAERKTYILVRGRLIPIPDGLQFMVPTRALPMVTSPLFSWGTKLRMLGEVFTLRSNQDESEDESVADFVRRHFGREMVDRVAEPLLAGVYGGNAEHLSVRAVLPRFVEMEHEHGSLVRATLSSSRRTHAPAQGKQSSGGATASPQPLFTSLRQGMQEMVDALVAALPTAALCLRQEGVSLRRLGSQWQIDAAGAEQFDSVILAIPAPAAAALVTSFQPKLAELLARIQYTSSAAIVLAYDHVALPPGHGFLVPASEGRKILACTFVHKKFPYRAPEGSALLRCFISSARVPELLSYSDEALAEIAQQELRDILGLAARPSFVRVFRWPRALPQYEIGHLERAAEVEGLLRELPGLSIIGNSLYGIGVPDCIRSARLAAAKITSAVLQPA
ncbi:MAG TPA: protoporphyrinogen oxidase [Terriglobales bacterium]